MRGRTPILEDYGWPEAQVDLECGIHLAVVAARLGEPEDYVREVAADQGWPIAWEDHPVGHRNLSDFDA